MWIHETGALSIRSGVEQLGPNAIDIRMALKTKPSEQFEVGRQLRERINAAFEAEGIEIPAQHVLVPEAAAA